MGQEKLIYLVKAGGHEKVDHHEGHQALNEKIWLSSPHMGAMSSTIYTRLLMLIG